MKKSGRQGFAALQELSGTIGTAQRVVLLLAASDVTLLRVKIPPLSAARLKAAWVSAIKFGKSVDEIELLLT